MSSNSEYGQPKIARPVELEYDGTPIARPPDTVITFDPSVGYGEAATSDRDLMAKRIEAASKQSLAAAPAPEAKPKSKKASKKK